MKPNHNNFITSLDLIKALLIATIVDLFPAVCLTINGDLTETAILFICILFVFIFLISLLVIKFNDIRSKP